MSYLEKEEIFQNFEDGKITEEAAINELLGRTNALNDFIQGHPARIEFAIKKMQEAAMGEKAWQQESITESIRVICSRAAFNFKRSQNLEPEQIGVVLRQGLEALQAIGTDEAYDQIDLFSKFVGAHQGAAGALIDIYEQRQNLGELINFLRLDQSESNMIKGLKALGTMECFSAIGDFREAHDRKFLIEAFLALLDAKEDVSRVRTEGEEIILDNEIIEFADYALGIDCLSEVFQRAAQSQKPVDLAQMAEEKIISLRDVMTRAVKAVPALEKIDLSRLEDTVRTAAKFAEIKVLNDYEFQGVKLGLG